MANGIFIDIDLAQRVFGDLTRLQGSLGNVATQMNAVDRSFNAGSNSASASINSIAGAANNAAGRVDRSMHDMAADLLAPIQRTQELQNKLSALMDRKGSARTFSEMARLKTEISGVQRELDRVNPGGMETRVGGAFGRVRSMAAGIVGPLAGAFAIGGIIGFGQGVVKAAGDMQLFQSSLNNIIGSKAQADVMFKQVRDFANETPFDLPEVQAASKQLLAMGFASRDVIPQLRTLGNVSSALGQPVGDIAYLFGTARQQGRLFTNDLNQFTGRGVPIVAELAKVMGVAESEVRKLTEEGKVGFAQLQQAFENLGGPTGRWGKQMADASKTIPGQLSNLRGQVGDFMADLGIMAAPMIEATIGGLMRAMDGIKGAIQWIKANTDTLVPIFIGVAGAVGLYTTALLINQAAAFRTAVLEGGVVAALGLKTIALGFTSAATNIATVAQWAWNAAMTANPIGLVIAGIALLIGVVVACWENFEGFRAFLYGLWESIKVIFEGIKAVVLTAFSGIIKGAEGIAEVLQGIWNLDFDQIAGGFKKFASGVVDNITAPFRAAGEVVKQAEGLGEKVSNAYAKGHHMGVLTFRTEEAEDAIAALNARDKPAGSGVPGMPAAGSGVPGVPSAVPSTDAFKVMGMTPGQPGAQGAHAPDDKSAHHSKGKGDGVTVGGAGGDGGRNITMNVTMNMQFPIGKGSVDTDVRTIADKVAQVLFNKLNDAQLAAG